MRRIEYIDHYLPIISSQNRDDVYLKYSTIGTSKLNNCDRGDK